MDLDRDDAPPIVARRVEAARGLFWLYAGLALFRANPRAWLGISSTLLMLWLTLNLVPVLGQLALGLLSPVFLAGVMLGCQAQQAGKELRLGHLFEGFRRDMAPLVSIGGLYLIGNTVVLGVILTVAGPDAMQAAGGDVAETAAAGVPPRLRLALLVGLALSLPLTMAMWFAPMLALFRSALPFQAIRASFAGCQSNWLPFLIYGVLLTGVLLAVILVAELLGRLGTLAQAAWMVLAMLHLFPVLFASMYVSYRDVYPDPPEPAEALPG